MPDCPPLPDETTAPAPSADDSPALPELSPAACAARLAELFPAVFTAGAPKPLKLRIQSDVQQRAPGIFTKKALAIFLHRHTTNTAYLRAIVGSPQRIDLDGMPAGDIADEHRQAAAAELERRRAMHDARREAERGAQRSAHDEARRARAAEDEQRREAATLLHAFETTTLTRTNFRALKGLSEVQLDALLAQARQAPQPDRPAAHPTERGPRPVQQPASRHRPPPGTQAGTMNPSRPRKR